MTTFARSFGTPCVPARDFLGARELRRGLLAMLRRRVPATEIDDVAQTVLCDALASESVPADPVEVRRWIAGIARHKVADYHRQAARKASVIGERRTDELVEPVADPAPFEQREILAGVLGATRTRRERETMEWLVREHAGELLSEIATENGLPPAVVRQRVSRLRRALRTQWAAMLGVLVLAAAMASALGLAREHVAGIAPDPSVTPADVPAVAVPVTEGDWTVERVSTDASTPAALRGAIEVEAKTVVVRVRGAHVEILGRTFRASRRVASIGRGAQGELEAVLTDASGVAGAQRAFAVVDGDRMVVTIEQGRVRGTAVLRRAPR